MDTTRRHAPRRQRAAGRQLLSAVFVIALGLVALSASVAVAQEIDPGLATIPSSCDFARTTANLERAIADEGLTLVTTIDHAASAYAAGLDLLPTTVFVFGNPRAGTPLMQEARTIALDLPQKMLVWQDEAGDVFVTWREPAAFGPDHGLAADHGPLPNIAALLASLARSATRAE